MIDVDSFAWHRSRSSFEEDRRRDAIHTVAGRRTLRPTHRRIEHETGALLADASRLLTDRWGLRAPG